MVTEKVATEKSEKGIQYKNRPIYGVVKLEGREPELMIGLVKSPFIAFVPLNGVTEKDFVGKTETF